MKFLLQNYPDTSAKLGLASEEATGQVAFTILSGPRPLPKQGGGAVRGVMPWDLCVDCRVSGQQLQLKGTALDPCSLSLDY